MTENMKKFLEAVSKNDELTAKLNTMNKEDLLALAKDLGVDLTEADFAEPAGEMNDDELETVTGGGECFCAVGGGGTKDGKNKACACVVAGNGIYVGNETWDIRCQCVAIGNGTDGPA